MIGHMQIRAEGIIILICKRWGHVTVSVITYIDLLRNISADLQRRHLLPGVTSSTPTTLLHLSPASSSCCHFFALFIPHLSIHSRICFYLSTPFNSRFPFSLPSRSRFFFIRHIIVLSQLDLPPKPLNNLPPNLPSSVAFPLSRVASPSLHLSGRSAFIHLKPQLMMNETNLPWAQTWVALWGSGLLPKGSSGLIPYSWAASKRILLVLCISRDPSLSRHPIFKVNSLFSSQQFLPNFFFVLKAAYSSSPSFSTWLYSMSELFLWNLSLYIYIYIFFFFFTQSYHFSSSS